MESKVNYTVVGLFVVLLITAMFSSVYWLEQYGGKQEYDRYRVYMSESVAGLSPDAAVRYRGVRVGNVEQISINPHNSEQVELLLKIKHNTPVKKDATASLKFFGLTGLAYIELAGSSKKSPLLKPSASNIPVIPATASTFTRIDETLRGLSAKSTQVLDKFNRLLNDKNLQNIQAMLTEIKTLSHNINKQIPDFHLLLTNGVSMEQSMTHAFKKIGLASSNVSNMATSLQKNYANVGHKLNRNVEQSLAAFNQLVEQLNDLTIQLQTTVQNFQASPSDLLFKRTEIKPGPGEKGYHE